VTLKRLLRRLTDKVIDATYIIKTPIGLQHTAVILHGDSCVGKSTILRQLKRRYVGCAFMEADNLMYWKMKADPRMLSLAGNLLTDTGVEKDKANALVRSIEQFGQLPDMAYSPNSVMVELLKTCLVNDCVMATCGNLPPPHGEFGYYQLLAECTEKTMVHALIAPDKAELEKRIRSRGQVAQLETLLEGNDWRLRNKSYYNVVLTGNESTARILELIHASIGQTKAST